jgi:archaeosortase A (PGF-CTERM-specific)
MLNKPVVVLSLMIPAWLISNLLWLGLLLLLASVLARSSPLAGLGWAIFGCYWVGEPAHFLGGEDYFNAALSMAAAIACFYLALRIWISGSWSRAYIWASYAAAICGIIYYPFAQIEPLRTGLISVTAQITAGAMAALAIPASMEGWNIISLNGRTVEIVLACTAIESIALFAGVILSVEAPLSRKLLAVTASTCIIYTLNIVRNGFVLMAYGWEWFGQDSFFLAHNVVAKAGSTLALLAVAYLVLILLPELASVMDELLIEMRHPGGESA